MTTGSVLLGPAAFVVEARDLLAGLGDADLLAFRMRFGPAALDLALDDGNRAVGAVAVRLALENASRVKVVVTELDHLGGHLGGRSQRCPHVEEGAPGTIDLLHRTHYCDESECVELFIGERSPDRFPGEDGELVLVRDVWCDCCGADVDGELTGLTIEMPSGDLLVGEFCASCAGALEELS